MKTIESNNRVVNSPNFTTQGFSIQQKNLGKIINIVENDIYSDKILAVIREYSCNAYDANVEAGKRNTPIVVTLPSKIESEFKVRDYGNGLTETEIHEIYTSYGESTKGNSDDFIGQLGIGSKSGFAYGDNFVVTSWKNGIKTVYNAVKGSEVREMVRLYSEESKEASGIEVSIPVKTGDDVRFKNKSLVFFSNWDIKPKIIGVSETEINSNTEVVLDGEGWAILNSLNSDSVAVMGNITYPIKWSLVKEALNKTEYGQEFNNILLFINNNRVMFKFKIGELQIAPSREALQYTERTNESIIKKLKEFQVGIENYILEKINSSETMWEYKCNLHDIFSTKNYSDKNASIFHSISNMEIIFGLVRSKLNFNGKDVDGSRYQDINRWDTNNGLITDRNVDVNVVCNSYNVSSGDKLFDAAMSNKYEYHSVRRDLQASKFNHIMIMDEDRKSHIKNCYRWYITENKVNRLYVLTFGNDVVKTAFFNHYDFSGATIVKFSDVFAKYKTLIPKRSSTRDQSSLNDTTVIGSKGFYMTHYPGRRYNISNGFNELFSDHDSKIDLKNETGYYLNLNVTDSTITVNGTLMSSNMFGQFISKLISLKVIDDVTMKKVCRFNNSIVTGKKFATNKTNWVNFVTHIEESMQTWQSLNMDIFKAVVFKDVVSECVSEVFKDVVSECVSVNYKCNNFYINRDFLGSIVKKLSNTHFLTEFCNTITDRTVVYGDSVNKMTKEYVAVKNEILNMFNVMASKYPMIKTLVYDRRYSNPTWVPVDEYVEEIANYIKFIDNSKKSV